MRSIPDLHISSNIIGVATSLVLWMAETIKRHRMKMVRLLQKDKHIHTDGKISPYDVSIQED